MPAFALPDFPVFLIPARRLVWQGCFDQAAFQCGTRVVLSKRRFMGAAEALHQFAGGQGFVSKRVEKFLDGGFILVGGRYFYDYYI
ncbi:MAG: hypothetical protein IKZ66_05645 [Schwartzia sp.]|nr:hypothetical protein [Schwartzia sp. (in: firmicutes)]